jgi:transcriptional regulator with XRE-family HTH domain
MNKNYIKIIFGIKIKKLREEHGLSLKQLSSRANISLSYLNEIENGKKHPNPEKIAQLADAFDVSYDQLVTLKVNKELTPIANFLSLDFVNDELLETFGIEKTALLNILLNDPLKVSAFLNAGIEIGRNYQMEAQHFYFLCLRAYQELNENYFEEIEDIADQFRASHLDAHARNLSSALYQHFLEKDFEYQVSPTNFKNYPKLTVLRSVFIPEKKMLLYNSKLTESQKLFLFAKEIGFEKLELKKRPYTTSWLKVESFDHVINNFKASYFAQALHIERNSLLKDLESFFQQTKFKSSLILNLLEKYNASPEMLFTRITNLLPKFFGINEVFFIRYSSKEAERNLKEISKEMHLVKSTSNLEYAQKEQNFRREITRVVVRYLNEELESKQTVKTAAFISQSPNGNEYLTISILMPMPELNNKNNSITIGFVLTDSLKKKINFISDTKFQSTELQQYFDAKRKSSISKRENDETLSIHEQYEKLKKDVQYNAVKTNSLQP